MVRSICLALFALTLATPASAQFGNNGCNPSGQMLSQQSVTTSTRLTLTPPLGTTYITVAVRQGASAINYSWDGLTTPTTGATGAGNQLNPGQTVSIWGVSPIANFQAIAAIATTAVDINFCR